MHEMVKLKKIHKADSNFCINGLISKIQLLVISEKVQRSAHRVIV